MLKLGVVTSQYVIYCGSHENDGEINVHFNFKFMGFTLPNILLLMFKKIFFYYYYLHKIQLFKFNLIANLKIFSLH